MAERRVAMLVQAHLRIRHRGCVTEALTDGAYATHVSADREADIMVVHGPGEVVQRFLDRVAATAGPPVVLARTAESVVCRAAKPRVGVLPLLVAEGCSILWPAVYRDGLESYTVLAPTRAHLAAAVGKLQTMGDVEVEGMAEVRPDALEVQVALGDLTSGLTQRQLRVLEMAVRAGYYSVPRRTSTARLARVLGISRSTFEEHLRKAEQRVLERFGAMLAAHPGLVQGATRSRGRPRREGLSPAAPRSPVR